jgi:molybdate transport system ATP-binding protein
VSAGASGEIAAGPAGLALQLRQAAPIPLDAAFACAPGEVLALVGPSGSGKSTILRAIAGHYRPSAGRIAVNGSAWYDTRARVDLPPHRRRAGLVFQSYALFPHLSAHANVTAALGHLPPASRADRAAELLDVVHLAGLGHRRPAELSGGQQQRVAVARALARDPEVLLLDEPFSAVDKTTRQKLYRELAEMRRRLAMPVILVTHDLDEATLLADRMVLLQRGRTLQDGAPADLMARPASAAAARLVGLRNLFAGRLDRPAANGAHGVLAWRGHLLEVAVTGPYAAGADVAWLVPPGGVVLHRRDRPSRGERENPIGGRVTEFLRLADQAVITLQVDDDPELPLGFSVPWHTAVRNGIGLGEMITVSLLADTIHLMPPADPAGDIA